jgi:ribonuclease HII
MPDLSLEAFHAQRLGLSPCLVCGVDEAGRGPWAGPVSVAAVILDPSRLPQGIDDSKKLTAPARERLFNHILENALASSIIMIDARQIDATNILAATYLGMSQAVTALGIPPSLALIDGNRAPSLNCPSVTIIKGDTLSLSIAAASILAKVARDRVMQQAEHGHPGYGFGQHKGYGVPQHIEALDRLGPCALHRMSFKPVAAAALRFGRGLP